MIRYSLNIDVKGPAQGIDYRDGLVFAGSCFSEHIADRLKLLGFSVFSQPNGIVFNPISLADPFQRIFGKGDYKDEDLISHEGLWHSKFHHGSFSEASRQDVLRKANHMLHELKRRLHAARFMFLTFGSSYVYELTETGEIVANCHRLPADAFRKRLLKPAEIFDTWSQLINEIKQFNPHLQIVLTVSPVKHLRDGVIENNRSKSALFSAITMLEETDKELIYFPAFELVNDDLRDYRFYAQDAAHPGHEAIDYVFGKFTSTYLTSESLKYIADIEKYLQMKQHRIRREGGEAYILHMKHLEDMRNELNARYSIEL